MSHPHRPLRLLLCLGMAFAAKLATAQTPASLELRNVVQLAATGLAEAPQDWMTLTLAVSKDGSDAAQVQAGLRQALDGAMRDIRKTAQASELDLHSGAFSVQPRYTNEGKISGWIGNAELVLEGGDFARIGAAASRAPSLSIRSLVFGLSRQTRAQLETQAQSLAIENFKQKAAQVAHGFGFADYQLRELSVALADPSQPMPRMMAMSARGMAADAAPLPLEAGKSSVNAVVSGTVQLK